MKGTDITEAFEVHHINEELAVQLLPKYYVRSTQQTRRNSPFTFHENDFYCTLKRNVRDALKTIPHHQVTGAIRRSKCITDTLLASYLSTALLAVYWHSFIVGLVSGIFLSLTAIAAHNYFHQRDNFRRHYFAFTMMQSKYVKYKRFCLKRLVPIIYIIDPESVTNIMNKFSNKGNGA